MKLTIRPTKTIPTFHYIKTWPSVLQFCRVKWRSLDCDCLKSSWLAALFAKNSVKMLAPKPPSWPEISHNVGKVSHCRCAYIYIFMYFIYIYQILYIINTISRFYYDVLKLSHNFHQCLCLVGLGIYWLTGAVELFPLIEGAVKIRCVECRKRSSCSSDKEEKSFAL